MTGIWDVVIIGHNPIIECLWQYQNSHLQNPGKEQTLLKDTMDQQLLSILRCPVTGSALCQAEVSLVELINQRIKQGTQQTRMMEQLEVPIDAGLINQDRSLLMPIYRGIPDMNPDDAISLTNLDLP